MYEVIRYGIKSDGITVRFKTEGGKHLTSAAGANVAMKADEGQNRDSEAFTRYDDTCTYSGNSYSCFYLKASSGKYVGIDTAGYWYPNVTDAASASRLYFAAFAELPIKKYSTLDRYYKVTDMAGTTGVDYSAVSTLTWNHMFRFQAIDYQWFSIKSEYNWKFLKNWGNGQGIRVKANEANNQDQWQISYPTAAHDYFTILNRNEQVYLSLSDAWTNVTGENEKFTPFQIQTIS